jgi:hypothetical protein
VVEEAGEGGKDQITESLEPCVGAVGYILSRGICS